MPTCLKSKKFLFFNWTKRSFIVFHNTRRTVIWFGCRLRRRHHITYSSPSSERGLTTVFYVLDNDYCYLYTNDRSSRKLLLLILLKILLNFWTREVGVWYRNKDVTVALNIPHDLTAKAVVYRHHYYIHKS